MSLILDRDVEKAFIRYCWMGYLFGCIVDYLFYGNSSTFVFSISNFSLTINMVCFYASIIGLLISTVMVIFKKKELSGVFKEILDSE